MLSMSSKLQKYILFIFNFIFVLTGISLITVGLITKYPAKEYEPVIDADYTYMADLVVFIGCFVFVVAFFGCCGALREHHCMLFTFSVIMAAIFVAEMTVGIFAYRLRAETKEIVAHTLDDAMIQYNRTADITSFWDTLQSNLDCCGAKSPADWTRMFPNNSLPISCCTPPHGAIGVFSCSLASPTLHSESCLDALSLQLEANASTVGLAGIIIAVVQLLGVIFSCNLAHSIRNNYQSV